MKTLFNSIEHLQDALDFHRERHAVLAGNVANVDTPGYQPIDIERASPLLGAAGAMARTNGRHMDLNDPPAGGVRTFDDPSASVGGDDNAVSVDRELAKLDANRVRYTTSADLTSRRIALLRYGAGDGNG